MNELERQRRLLGEFGVGLGGLSIVVALVPLVGPLRRAFGVAGTWTEPSSWYLSALAMGAIAIVVGTVAGPRPRDRRATLAWVLGAVGCALATLAGGAAFLMSVARL